MIFFNFLIFFLILNLVKTNLNKYYLNNFYFWVKKIFLLTRNQFPVRFRKLKHLILNDFWINFVEKVIGIVTRCLFTKQEEQMNYFVRYDIDHYLQNVECLFFLTKGLYIFLNSLKLKTSIYSCLP